MEPSNREYMLAMVAGAALAVLAIVLITTLL